MSALVAIMLFVGIDLWGAMLWFFFGSAIKRKLQQIFVPAKIHIRFDVYDLFVDVFIDDDQLPLAA